MTLCLGAAATAVAAASAGLEEVRLETGGTLRSGESVSAAWAPLPEGTEEFELLLRVESEIPFTLRLTECEEPSLTGLSWRVPDFPCSRARLLLRHGRRGREILWGTSAPFRIVAGRRAHSHHVVLRGGELWVREGAAPPWRGLHAGDSRAFSAPNGIPFEADGPSAGPEPLPPPEGRLPARVARPSAPALVTPTSRAPQDLPLRI